MRKAGVLVEEPVMARVAPGVVVPIPSLPAKLELVVEVETRKPVVSWPMVEEEMSEFTACSMLANKVVVVAFVTRRFVKVEVAVEVAVMTPVVS
jgi:hypothetical protein